MYQKFADGMKEILPAKLVQWLLKMKYRLYILPRYNSDIKRHRKKSQKKLMQKQKRKEVRYGDRLFALLQVTAQAKNKKSYPRH